MDSQGRQYMHWKTCAHLVPPKRVVLNFPISYAQTTLWAILPPTSRDWPIFSPFVYVSPLRSPLFCPRQCTVLTRSVLTRSAAPPTNDSILVGGWALVLSLANVKSPPPRLCCCADRRISLALAAFS